MYVCGECGERFAAPGACSNDAHPLVAAADSLLGLSVGRYRLARTIATGGMGRVYLGVQPEIGGRVAIKVLSEKCAEDPDLVDRFFAEARAVNLISHENIVKVVDMATLEDGRPYIVMEFVDGPTLTRAARGGRAPLGGVVRVSSDVLSAIGAAHAIGIVHRDLKPDNVIVTSKGHAKVLDFGIAKLAPQHQTTSAALTVTGALLGTPAYMAPEQISGARDVDARADLYAVGAVMFHAVTGRSPFGGATMFDIMRAQIEEQPPSPRTLRPDLPPSIEHVIVRALAKDPAMRWPSATAMADALDDAANDIPDDQWFDLSPKASPMRARGSGPRVAPTTPPPMRRDTPPAISVAVRPSQPVVEKPSRRLVVLGVAAAVACAIAVFVAVRMLSSSSLPAPTPAVAIAAAPIAVDAAAITPDAASSILEPDAAPTAAVDIRAKVSRRPNERRIAPPHAPDPMSPAVTPATPQLPEERKDESVPPESKPPQRERLPEVPTREKKFVNPHVQRFSKTIDVTYEVLVANRLVHDIPGIEHAWFKGLEATRLSIGGRIEPALASAVTLRFTIDETPAGCTAIVHLKGDAVSMWVEAGGCVGSKNTVPYPRCSTEQIYEVIWQARKLAVTKLTYSRWWQGWSNTTSTSEVPDEC